MLLQKTALVVVDAQKGFHNPVWGQRNNPMAEKNIKLLLQFFRDASWPVIHIQHLSTDPNSPLHPTQPGVGFIDDIEPKLHERVFQKTVNSAFIGTDLELYLKSEKVESLTMVGFTSDHCVSTSARMASNLGFNVTIIADATVAFQRTSLSGKILAPDLVHEVSLASLSKEFAVIENTNEVGKRSLDWYPFCDT